VKVICVCEEGKVGVGFIFCVSSSSLCLRLLRLGLLEEAATELFALLAGEEGAAVTGERLHVSPSPATLLVSSSTHVAGSLEGADQSGHTGTSTERHGEGASCTLEISRVYG